MEILFACNPTRYSFCDAQLCKESSTHSLNQPLQQDWTNLLSCDMIVHVRSVKYIQFYDGNDVPVCVSMMVHDGNDVPVCLSMYV